MIKFKKLPNKISLAKATLSLLMLLGVIATKIYTEPLCPPSVPLMACDPCFSIWSPGDKLTDVNIFK